MPVSMPRQRRPRSHPSAMPPSADIPCLTGPNAAPPASLTPEQRRDEIVALLARGVLRRLTVRLLMG